MEEARRALWCLAQRLAAEGQAAPRPSLLEASPHPASGGGGGGSGAGTAAAAALLRQATSAAIAAALAASVGGTVALCEASPDPDSARVHAAVHSLWLTLVEQAHRVEAALSRDSHLPEIPPPEVHVSGGGEVEVTWRLPQELDIPGALRALRAHLRSPAFASIEAGSWGSSVSESISSGAEGRTHTLFRRSRGLGALSVDVFQPHNQEEPARLCFRASEVSERDLELMRATLQAAMAPRRRGPLEELQELGRLFEGGAGAGGGPFGRALEGSVDPFFEHLREFMEGFQRMADGEGWQVEVEEGGEGEHGAWPGERDTEPTPLRGPKRFEDWRSQQHGRRGGGGGSAGAHAGSEPATPVQLEQRRKQRQLDAAVQRLEKAGAQVFAHQLSASLHGTIDWGSLAGYEEQKRQIADVLLSLVQPEVFAEIAHGTRTHYACNRPRAVLFEGPPGTGKTTSARVIALQAGVPLVYIPLEAVVSKWYGESEKQLADMLQACESFPDGCVVFLDEVDALATSRSSDMHEATRRVLGVLLRHLDGFDASKRTVVIAATNRKEDLDPALISRFSLSVVFGLPNEACRSEILRQFAHQLQDAELLVLAHATPGMAGRDLRAICEQAERRWASKIIRGQAARGQLPPLAEYLDAARQRLRQLAGLQQPDGSPLGGYQTT